MTDETTSSPTRLAVLGAGSWGTSLAITLSSRFEHIALWAHSPEQAQQLRDHRQNFTYLPGFALAPNIIATDDLALALQGADVVLVVVPSRYLRSVLTAAAAYAPTEAVYVSATKGLEQGTLKRMSQVVADTIWKGARRDEQVCVLSGPTFAREIAAGEPAAVVIASADRKQASRMQRCFATSTLRLYASDDVIGTELGGSLKNVIAIGAGICDGLGLGSNTLAALVTRGLAEMTRLAVTMGAHPRTLAGLAGLGDLILTTTGSQSRNRSLGVDLARGKTLVNLLANTRMVAEGVWTCQAANDLAAAHSIDVPIMSEMKQILYEGKDPRAALRELLDRPLTRE